MQGAGLYKTTSTADLKQLSYPHLNSFKHTLRNLVRTCMAPLGELKEKKKEHKHLYYIIFN